MKARLRPLLLLACASPAAAGDWWDQPPIRYSTTTAATPPPEKFQSGDALGRVREMLARLGIPESSQTLVFSKTSLQKELIGPRTPRAMWFSENAYVAWVPGGNMETITHDPAIGPVFHTVELREKQVFIRETDACFSCHGGSRTKDVPGPFVRSVFPDDLGRPIGAHGSHEVDAATPVPLRWGGFYVTGSSSLPHFGNLTFLPEAKPVPQSAGPGPKDVTGEIGASSYPHAKSDIVALLVIEHQCGVYNLLTAASYRHQRTRWTSTVFGTSSDAAQRGAEHDARAIVDALLFRDAAPLGDGVEGSEAFQRDFRKRFPESTSGKSLADFHLGSRLFRHRCSYMVYSAPFSTLPPPVSRAVVQRLRAILEHGADAETYSYLGEKERSAISSILTETLPAYTAGG